MCVDRGALLREPWELWIGTGLLINSFMTCHFKARYYYFVFPFFTFKGEVLFDKRNEVKYNILPLNM